MKSTETILRCAITGIEWSVPFFPGAQKAEFIHPIFSVPLKTLWKNVPLRMREDWDMEESALFTLACFAKTEVVKFLPATPEGFITQEEQVILFEESERIFALIQRMLHCPSSMQFPQIVIQIGGAKEHALSRLPDFLYILHDEIDKHHENYSERRVKKKNADRLLKLERFIRKNAVTSKNKKALGKILGEWASISAEFDAFYQDTETPFGAMSLTQYWKLIISLCISKTGNLWQIPAQDFRELLGHCEENLNHGTFYAAELMRFLREGAAEARDSFGFDNLKDFDFLAQFETEKNCFQILDEFSNPISQSEDKSAEILSSFIATMKLEAPKEEPKRAQFQNALEYMRAKARWELLKTAEKGSENV